MEDYTNQVLPYLIGYLRERPGQCDTFDNICNDLQDITIGDPNINQEIVRAALEQSIYIGKDFGILASRNGIIRIPFNLKKVENLNAVEDTCPTKQQKHKTRNLQSLVKNASNKPEKTTHLEPELDPENFEIKKTIKSLRKKRQETYRNPRPDCKVQVSIVWERTHSRTYAFTRGRKSRARSYGRRRRSTRRKR